jgi:hypothetical protein
MANTTTTALLYFLMKREEKRKGICVCVCDEGFCVGKIQSRRNVPSQRKNAREVGSRRVDSLSCINIGMAVAKRAEKPREKIRAFSVACSRSVKQAFLNPSVS